MRQCNLLRDQLKRLQEYDLPRMRPEFLAQTLSIGATLRGLQNDIYDLRGQHLDLDEPVNESQR